MEHEITLNLSPRLTEQEWALVLDIYQDMPGWRGRSDEGCPLWFGREDDFKYITVSVEPSGLLVTGKMEFREWTSWLTMLCSKLTLALGTLIYDAEI